MLRRQMYQMAAPIKLRAFRAVRVEVDVKLTLGEFTLDYNVSPQAKSELVGGLVR
jgi:hypothetical protein